MINPRGSTGYGQKFTDEITDDWGGKVYEDLMKGTDFVLAKYPFVDASRVAAAGGSYGGYLVDLISPHTGPINALLNNAPPITKPRINYPTHNLTFREH